MRRFAAGESVVWRSVDRERGVVQTVWPWTVVRDDPDGIVLYLPAGTVGKQRTGTRGGPRGRMMLEWDGGHRDVAWHSTNVIRLYREDDDFSIWIARDASTDAVLWRYINLEDPWRRTVLGFDSKDRYLDLYAERDETEWHWKDEDELAWLLERGDVDAAFAAVTRESGERAVARLRSGDLVVDDRWGTWRADPAWPTPIVPAAWRELHPVAAPSSGRFAR